MKLDLAYYLRSAPFGAPSGDLFAAVLDQCAWADSLGFDRVILPEHHSIDGELPSPIVLAAAIAGRTRRMRIHMGILLPLYHPIRLAEELAILDLVSGGRVEAALVLGFLRSEYELFGVDFGQRAKLIEEGIEVLKKAWTGEPFEFEGKTVQLRPSPFQKPRPPIIMGGNSEEAARRAARIADVFSPLASPKVMKAYRDERIRLNLDPDPPVPDFPRYTAPVIVHVSESPDKAWERVGPYCVYVSHAQSGQIEVGKTDSPDSESWVAFAKGGGIDQVRKTGHYRIVTPEECVQIARRENGLIFQPLVGGIPPEIAWESLKLVEAKVLPELRNA